MRPVINLKGLNEWVSVHETIRNGGVPILKDILQSGGWYVKVYLKDAYFRIPIDCNH